MHGNVWEWVQDCWNEGYRGEPADVAPGSRVTVLSVFCEVGVSRMNRSPSKLPVGRPDTTIER